ncbi:MAG: class I SAM-dependent methyltransferase [Elusimicrobiota bacterium]|nr:MAG: class I SAM-dependent methyltransferase [Elusimicrobiota bacterium]
MRKAMAESVAMQGTPALRYRVLTPLYDFFIRLLMPERNMREALAARIAPRPGMRVLDLGCGTGTFGIMLARASPGTEVIGIDPDPDIVRMAERKAASSTAGIAFKIAGAEALPFDRDAFDIVASTLVFHHLPPTVKRAALREALRVLRPGGRLLILDFGRPAGPVQVVLGYAAAFFDGWATTAENVAGMVPELMREAGFTEVRRTYSRATLFGTLHLNEGKKKEFR